MLQPCLQPSLLVLTHLGTVPAPEDTGDVRGALAHACISHSVGGRGVLWEQAHFPLGSRGLMQLLFHRGSGSVFASAPRKKGGKIPFVSMVFSVGRDIARPGWPGEGRDAGRKWEEPVPILGDAAVGERLDPFEQGKSPVLWVFCAPSAAQVLGGFIVVLQQCANAWEMGRRTNLPCWEQRIPQKCFCLLKARGLLCVGLCPASCKTRLSLLSKGL